MELNKVEKPNKLIVDINNLNIGYNNQTILSNINLQIPQGQCWAIIGPSGSGKSSILNLIPRFYDPDKGNVKIDNQDIKELTISSVRSSLALRYSWTSSARLLVCIKSFSNVESP